MRSPRLVGLAMIVVIAALSLTVVAVEPARADALDDFIARFYLDVLDRTPDPSGLAGWKTFLQANCNAAGFDTLARGFFGSTEFLQTKRLTMNQLVTKLYITFLGRNPDAAGLGGWVDVFRQARLRVALNGFVPSVEFQSLIPDRTNRTAVRPVVARLYTEILGRDPDPAGLEGWVDVIATTGDLENVARGFLASSEFEGRQLTFGEYVRILYRTFLNRDADPAGLAGWEGVLVDTLFQVINAGFVPSSEFQAKRASICPGGGTSVPNILGTYTGSLSETFTGCSDPADNGTASGNLLVNITSQSGSSFSGTAVSQIAGVQITFTTFGGTVNSAGAVSGTFTYSGGGATGSGNFSGNVANRTITGTINGQDNPPSNCRFTGSFNVTRP